MGQRDPAEFRRADPSGDGWDGGHLDAIICVEDHRLPLVHGLLRRAGYEIAGEVESGIDLVALAADLAPDLVVLDLAYVGGLGMRIFPILRLVTPGCRIVVLSPLDVLDIASLEHGADAVVSDRDPASIRAAIARSREATTSR